VDLRVRSFEYEVAASGGLFLAVDEDLSFQGGKASKVQQSHLKAVIGD
jgi:hypothetical protein